MNSRVYLTSGSSVWRSALAISDQSAVHAIGEVDYDLIHNLQTRVIAVLDLNFSPEP